MTSALWAIGLTLLAGDPGPSPDRGAYQSLDAKAGRDAASQVRLALWCEARGMAEERAEHLARALLADPNHAPARALLGQVGDGTGWRSPEKLAARAKADAELSARLAEYNDRRSRARNTGESQWDLAVWCEQQGLRPEATAHFTAVTRLEPTRDAAWKRLGKRKHEGSWRSPAEIAAERVRREAQRLADIRWGRELPKLRDRLRDESKRARAEVELAAVVDPLAAPLIWRTFVEQGGPADRTRAVQALGQVDAPAASLSLAALAVFDPEAEVRGAAALTLRRRDARDYLGPVVAMVRDPIKYQVKPVDGPGTTGVLFVEGERFNMRYLFSPPAPPSLPRLFADSVPFDPEGRLAADDPWGVPARNVVGPASGDNGRSRDLVTQARLRDRLIAANNVELQRVANSAQRQLDDTVASIDATNRANRRRYDVLLPVLADAAGSDLGESRRAWETWWADARGLTADDDAPRSGPKPTFTQQAPLADLPSYLRPHGSCFAAGTPVRTLGGSAPIESLKLGDRVLAQDTKTGALAYRPVVRTYRNPPHETLTITLGDDAIIATPIHRFWRVGRGWAMARELKPGDDIRVLGGAAKVASVVSAGVRPVFNLDVEGDHDYLVGRLGALAHDNTPVLPALAPFDAADFK